MNSTALRTLVSISAVILTGCGATVPRVIYEADRSADDKGYSKFQLQRSMILVDWKKDKDGKDMKPDIVLSSVPTDAIADPVYSIIPDDSFMVATHLKLVHRPNTNLIESLGTEIEDRRVQFIQQVGSVVAGLIPFFAITVDKEKLGQIPSHIDVTRLFIDDVITKEGEAKARGELHYTGAKLPDGMTTYDIKISRVAPDAIARASYLASIKEKTVSVLFFAACRDAQVQFTSGPGIGKVFNLRISDPNFVQTVQLPAKGKIELHTGCGVNVSSEKADVASDAKIASELISQIKTVRDAFKSDGKSASQASSGAKK